MLEFPRIRVGPSPRGSSKSGDIGMAGNCTHRIWITCTHGIVWYWGAGLGTRGFRGGTGVWNLHIHTGESVIFLKYFCLNCSPKSSLFSFSSSSQISSFPSFKLQSYSRHYPCPLGTWSWNCSVSAVAPGAHQTYIFHHISLAKRKRGDHPATLLGTNISPQKTLLKIIFLFPKEDMLVPWRVLASVHSFTVFHPATLQLFHFTVYRISNTMPKETIGSPSSLDVIFGWLTPWADSPEFIRVLDGCNHPTKILISCFAVYGIAITGEVEHSPNKTNQILNVFPIGPSWAAYWGYSTKKVQLNNQTAKSYLRHQSTETPWGFHFMHDADTTQLVRPHESWPCALGIAQVILLPLGALFSFNLLGSLHFCYKAPFF